LGGWISGHQKEKLAILGEYVGHLAIGAGVFMALLLFGGTLNRLVYVTSPIIGDDAFSEPCLSEKTLVGFRYVEM